MQTGKWRQECCVSFLTLFRYRRTASLDSSSPSHVSTSSVCRMPVRVRGKRNISLPSRMSMLSVPYECLCHYVAHRPEGILRVFNVFLGMLFIVKRTSFRLYRYHVTLYGTSVNWQYELPIIRLWCVKFRVVKLWCVKLRSAASVVWQ